MGGVSYTVGEQPVLVSFSSWPDRRSTSSTFRTTISGTLPARTAARSSTPKNSFAVRPGVGVTWTLAPRVAIVGFGGYMFNRPDIVYRDRRVEFRDRWKADAILLSVGAVYSLF